MVLFGNKFTKVMSQHAGSECNSTPASCPIIKASNNSLILSLCVQNHHTERTAPRFVRPTKLSPVLWDSYLQSWTKVLGQIYICGAFSNAPNKQSRANSSTLGQLLPPAPHLQCWTRVHVISPEFQHCIGGGGEQRNLKRITVLF